MAFFRIEQLSYEVENGGVMLEQDCGTGEVDRVFLHPIHVRLLATELGVLKGGDENAWRRVETLERRIDTLRDRIATLNERLWGQRTYPQGNNSDDPACIYSDATLELAEEFVADFPYLGPAEETQSEPTGTRTGIHGINPQGQEAFRFGEGQQ